MKYVGDSDCLLVLVQSSRGCGVGETDQAICITSHVDSGPDLEPEVFVEGKYILSSQVSSNKSTFLSSDCNILFRH